MEKSKKTTRFVILLIILLITVNHTGQAQGTNFLQGPPGINGLGLLGYINPAVAATLPGPQAMYFTPNIISSKFNHRHYNSGLFLAIPNFSFGYIRYKRSYGDIGQPSSYRAVTDYRTSLAFGSETIKFGIGYRHITRKPTNRSRVKDTFTFGTIIRPDPHFSAGHTVSLDNKTKYLKSTFDLGFRPFGDSRLTMFFDVTLGTFHNYTNQYYSIGASSELLTGMLLSTRYFFTKSPFEANNHIFSLGLNMCLGRTSLIAISSPIAGQPGILGLRYGSSHPSVLDHIKTKKNRYLYLDLPGTIKYTRYTWLDTAGPTLSSLLTTIQGAVTDPHVSGIALNLSGLKISAEQAWEVRRELAKMQQVNKKIIIYIQNGGMSLYHLASIADYLVLDPQAYLLLPGYALGRTYLKDLFAKLGLGFDEWRFFQYKSAYENYSRTSMSDPDRRQRQRLVDVFYSVFKEDVCSSRKFAPAVLDSLINTKAGFTASEAVTLGFADTLARWTDIDKLIGKIAGSPQNKILPAGLISNQYPPRHWGQSPRIAIAYAEGICALDSGIKGRSLSTKIRQIATDKRIKALILRVDSPGGDGLASDLVAEALQYCKKQKPVIISQGRVAASGGYWLSMYGHIIYAAPNTITGSIGVIGGWVWNKGLGSKLGISTDYVKAGEHADLSLGMSLPLFNIPLPNRNLAPDERSIIENSIREMYNDFVGKVSFGRHISFIAVKELAQGRVWMGRDAVKNGLVDKIGGLADAITEARKRAGIDKDAKIKLLEYPSKGLINPDLFLPDLFGFKTAALKPSLSLQYIKILSENNGRPLFLTPYNITVH